MSVAGPVSIGRELRPVGACELREFGMLIPKASRTVGGRTKDQMRTR